MNVTHANKVLAEVKALDSEIARLQAERATRVALLAAEAGQKPGKVTLDAGSFTVRENNSYSEDDMKAALSPGQIRRCSVSRLDKQAVKRLYPHVYNAAKKQNGVSVTIG